MTLTNNDRRIVAGLLFGAAIVGAMLPNYAGLMGFFRRAFPELVWWMPWLAALVYDAAWLAASWSTITGGAGRWSRIMLVGGVVGAVGANLRLAWLAADATGAAWTVDAILGHAALPIIGLCAVHGLAHYLSVVPADPKPAPAPAPVAASEPRAVAREPKATPRPKAASTPRKPARGGSVADWLPVAQAALDDGLSGGEAARLAGVNQSNVSRAIADGRLTRPELAISANGHGGA